MAIIVIVGAQWGDEGKGKIVDLLSEEMDYVARYQGGPNAGHTVVIGEDETILHQLPSGVLRPHVLNVVGNGVVIDPAVFMQEVKFVQSKGINLENRLFISDRAHLILPYHRRLDAAAETAQGKDKIGTTGRGIGPAYVDKFSRAGIRVGDLKDPEFFKSRLAKQIELKNRDLLKIYNQEPLDEKETISACREFLDFVNDFIADTSVILYDALKAGKNILAEGAQGTMLDVDYGTYPFVTSSNPIAGGACTGLGLGPTTISDVWGIVKAYTTRVGMGPFPTEFDVEYSEHIRQLGGEFGATTGRPRRCGWFDAVVLSTAVRVNGFTGLVMTKLDVLDTLQEIKICTGYKYKGKTLTAYPADLDAQENCEPVYETHPGWQTSTAEVRSWENLPENAKKYLSRISEILDVPIKIISVGPKRRQTFFV